MKRIFIVLFIVSLSLSIHSQTSQPTIKISTSQDNIKSGTGFKVLVNGNVTGAISLYTYLVVKDGKNEWIEPTEGFGKGIDGDFSGYCYLGEIDKFDPNNLKQYLIYAIVTTTPYEEYQHPVEGTIKSTSNKISLTRKRK